LDHKQSFPNLPEAFAIIFVLFVLQITLGAFLYDAGYQFEAGDPLYSLFVLLISMGTVLSVIMHYKKLSYTRLFNQSGSSWQSIALVLSPPLFLIAAGSVVWISDLASIVIYFVPMSEQDMDMFKRVFTGGVTSFLLICIIAPLIEEMLFRGIILRGLLNDYPPMLAVALSALLFALYHLNIYQFPVALIVGGVSGWLYVMTRSLWPSVMLHSFYNTISYTLFLLSGADPLLETGEVQFHGVAELGLSICVTLTGFYLLKRILLKP